MIINMLSPSVRSFPHRLRFRNAHWSVHPDVNLSTVAARRWWCQSTARRKGACHGGRTLGATVGRQHMSKHSSPPPLEYKTSRIGNAASSTTATTHKGTDNFANVYRNVGPARAGPCGPHVAEPYIGYTLVREFDEPRSLKLSECSEIYDAHLRRRRTDVRMAPI